LKKNHKVFDVEVRGNYEVSFIINPHIVSNGWRNILHITNNVGGGDHGIMGNRIPGIWFHSMTSKLHICTGCDGNPNLCLNPAKSLPVGKRTRVTIRVTRGYFVAEYDSQEVGRAKCSSPYKLSKGQLAAVYTSDRWYESAHAFIENLIYSSDFVQCSELQSGLYGAYLGRRIQLQKNHKVFDVAVREDYEVSFNLQPEKVTHGWSNIVHVTNNVGEGNVQRMGNRIPGVWFHSMTTKLHICTGCDGNLNVCLNPDKSLPLGKNTQVTIRVTGGFFTTQYDGEEVGRVPCSVPYKPPKGQLAAVYTSDRWYASAQAVIGNLVYSVAIPKCPFVQPTLKGAYIGRSIQLKKNHKVFDVEVRGNYEVSFIINPHIVSNGWRNILHITNNVGGGDHGIMGNRIPGIWFHSMTSKLHICTGCDGNPNLCLNPAKSLPVGKRTRVTIRVTRGYFVAEYDSQEVGRAKCSSPYKLSKGQLAAVYTSDRWYESAHALIENLVYYLL